MIEKIKAYLRIAALFIGAIFGYLYAANSYEKDIAVMRQQQADAVTSAQLSYKAEYEKRESALIASYLHDHDRLSRRVQLLESKLRVVTLTRERNRCLRLVVEGTGLVDEGRRIIEAELGSVERK